MSKIKNNIASYTKNRIPEPILNLSDPSASLTTLSFSNVPFGTTSIKSIRFLNPTHSTFRVAMERLPPADLGFSMREVDWTVEKGDCECLMKISWKPVLVGQQVKAKILVRIGRVLKAVKLIGKEGCPRKPLVEIGKENVNQPLKKSLPKENWENVKHKPSYSELPSSHLDTRKLSRFEKIQLDIARQNMEQNMWIDRLSAKTEDIVIEIQRLRRNFAFQLKTMKIRRLSVAALEKNATTVFKYEKVKSLLEWCQLICSLSGVSWELIPSNGDEIVFKILLNFYQTDPQPIEAVLTEEELALIRGEIPSIETSQWVDNFSAFNNDDYEDMNERARELVNKLAILFSKVAKAIQDNQLFSILLFVQSTFRTNLTIFHSQQRKIATRKLERFLYGYQQRKMFQKTKGLINLIQNRLRQQSEIQKSQLPTIFAQIIWTQSQVRKSRKQKLFREQLQSVRDSQASFLSTVDHGSFESDIGRIKLIQNMVRSQLEKQCLTHYFSNVLHLQCCIRTKFVCHRSSQNQKHLAFVQNRLSSNVVSNEYQRLRKAILMVQSSIRRNFNVSAKTKDIDSIRLLQSLTRMTFNSWMSKHAIYLTTQAQCQILQRKSILNMRRQKDCIISIQKLIRTKLAVHNEGYVRSLVFLCQNSSRKVYLQTHFKRVKLAIHNVQHALRSSNEQKNTLVMLNGLKTSQNLVRSCQTHYRTMNQLHTINMIQNLSRQQTCALKSVILINSTSNMQKLIRTMNAFHQTYWNVRKVESIQRCIRREVIPSIGDSIRKIVNVQNSIRRDYCMKTFFNWRVASLVIQGNWRVYKAMKLRHQGIQSIVLVQRIARCQRNLLSTNWAIDRIKKMQAKIQTTQSLLKTAYFQFMVTAVQSMSRTAKCLKTNITNRQRVLELQSIIRMHTTPKIPIQCIILSQNLLRTMTLRYSIAATVKSVEDLQKYQRKNVEACKLSKFLRHVNVVQKQLKQFQQQTIFNHRCTMVRIVQSQLRSNSQILQFSQDCASIQKVQTLIRSKHASLSGCIAMHSVQTLQNICRMKLASNRTKRKKFKALLCQRLIRQTICRHQTDQLISLVHGVQWMATCNQLQRNFLHEIESVKSIQSMNRGYQEVQNSNIMLNVIRKSQSIIRKLLVPSIHQSIHSIAIVQKMTKSIHCHNHFEQEKAMIIDFQCRLRRNRAQKHFSDMKCIINELQSSVRQQLVPTEMLKGNIVRVQSGIRSNTLQVQFSQERNSIQQMQNILRSLHESDLNNRRVIHIRATQCLLKKHFHQFKFLFSRMQIENTQIAFRTNQCQNDFREMLSLVTLCQSHIRAMEERKRKSKEFIDIQSIQEVLRRNFDMLNYCQSIELINSYRSYMASKIISNSMQKSIARIVGLQSIIRRKVTIHETKQKLRQLDIQRYSAILIQKHWRGFASRNIWNQTLQQILKSKLDAVHADFEERRQIAETTNKAMKVLLKSKQMSTVMNACSDLDQATKRSQKSCESMHTPRIVSQMFLLINACNRSAPHTQLLCHLLNILIHMTSYDSLCGLVFDHKDAIEILVEQLQMYRDKPEVFSRALKVIEQLVVPNDASNSEQHHRWISFRSMTGVLKQLKKVLSFLERKSKLESSIPTTNRRQSIRSMSTEYQDSFELLVRFMKAAIKGERSELG